MTELETLEDLEFINQRVSIDKGVEKLYDGDDLKQLAITHIKHMRREGRGIYNANIDEKSAIPKLMEIFNLNEKDLK